MASLERLFPGSGEMALRMRAFDWSRSALGAPEGWAPELRIAVGICLLSPMPLLLAWGPGLALLCNDAGMALLDPLRPPPGHPARQALAGVWAEIGPLVEAAQQRGRAGVSNAVALPADAGAAPTARRWRFACSPVPDADGRPGGAFCAVVEATGEPPPTHPHRDALRLEAALRASEAAQRFLVALNTAVQPLTDVDEIAAVTARALAEHLGVDRCAYAEVEPDQDHFLIGRDYTRPGTPSVVGRWRIGEFGTAALALLRANEPFTLCDAAGDARLSAAERAAYRAIEVGAVIAMPLHQQGRLVAGIVVNQRDARDWHALEIELVRSVTLHCWETIGRARALRSLRASEERFRRLADSMPHLVFSARPDGVVSWVNRYAREFTGVADERLGERRYGLIHPDDRARLREAWRRALADGTTYEIEARLRRADGAYRWVLSRALPVADESGRIVEWVGGSIDIDELRLAQQALQEADRRKDQFLATLAHELRNPLAPLRNAAHLLHIAPGADTARRVQPLMQRQIDQLVHLVDDLLEISRISGGKIELRRSVVRLRDVLSSAVETSRPPIEAGRHRLELDIPDEPLLLDADAVRLAQVFSNLLNNAAKYTDAGGRIVLHARREGGEAVVAVRDNGIGIAPRMLPHVFELFMQVDPSVRSQGGLGIGLALVKSLVGMHGGSVVASSPGLGRGSEFVVRLPLAYQAAAEPVPAGGAAAGVGRAPCRVLVVDDNRDAAESLGVLLEFLGASVMVVHDGPAALAALDVHQPTAVLLDIGMPGMDGYEVARRMRARPDGGALLLIALTGWGQAQDQALSRQAGFDHHLVKPADIEQLQALLGNIG